MGSVPVQSAADRACSRRSSASGADSSVSVPEGSEVHTGKIDGEDDWKVTSVLIDHSTCAESMRSRDSSMACGISLER
ncbi:hypothetical protein [Natrinema pallidum]|uniref:Uncharacterized protein n=1 Tax=Natrinema pallidum TaxID=69527 RepID=A0A4P9TFH0_9EURY|nr:hypothetical protein FGF80_09310 [Natrinema pallidum]